MTGPAPLVAAGASHFKAVVHELHRPNFIVVEPPSIDDWEMNRFDARHEAAKLARFDWQKEYGASAVIIDTASALGTDLLSYSAIAGLGKAKDAATSGEGDARNRYVKPMMQDFGVAQDFLESILRVWATQPIHKIVLGHRGAAEKLTNKWDEKQKKFLTEFDHFGLKGPGKKMSENIGALFSQYTYLVNAAGPAQSPIVHWYMQNYGDYRGKTRQLHPAAKPYIPLTWDHSNPTANLAMLRAAWDSFALWHGLQWGPSNGALAKKMWLCIYAESGLGKTTLATALPAALFAAGPVVYIGYDQNSVYMDSTFPQLLHGGVTAGG